MRRDDGQAVGLGGGACEVVGGRFAGGVGAVRAVGRGLGERGVAGLEGAEDLVGRDVDEAKVGRAGVISGAVEERLGT